MKIIHLTDIHGKKTLIEKIKSELQTTDIVLISGDITHFGRDKEAKDIISEINIYNNSVFAIRGNCDYPEVGQYLENNNISLEKKSVRINGFTIMGMGGSLPCPGPTPNEYSEEIFQFELNKIYNENLKDDNNIILLIHQPPQNTINDRVKPGLHVGSKSVRNFIEDKNPLLVLCGHIHEGKGVDNIGDTKIINPGAFKEGNYAIININKGEISVNLKKS